MNDTLVKEIKSQGITNKTVKGKKNKRKKNEFTLTKYVNYSIQNICKIKMLDE